MNSIPKDPQGASTRTVTIESILEVTSSFLYVETVEQLLEKIVKSVSETFGLARSHIGIKEQSTGLFAVRAAYGFSPEREKEIRKVRWTTERMMRDFKPELKIGKNAYYVPGEMATFEDEDILWVDHPERLDRARRFPDQWHEKDYIDFLMYRKDGNLLGYLEIDQPDNDKVPGDDTIKAIEIFSNLAAIAIQSAELYENLDRDRKNISLLVDLIGHDVNNYAQAVSGFIELAMARPMVPEPSRKSLGKALDQIWNLNRLVNEVKLYAKVEAAGNKDLRPMDLVTVIREAFRAAEAGAPNRTVRLILRDEKTSRFSDMNELATQVFVNLFSNAIKFDEHDEVLVEVDIDPYCREDRDMWCVSVTDHGPGVEDAFKNSIFNRFTQLAATSKGGSGLGLYITKTLVESYRGRIWVEDRIKGDRSQGSVFKVELPKAA